ncbi:adhesion G protein-coupled receptor F5-like [Brachionichthys hirsutus]|uniref:adhesion G protein-coupled receptor F5-like n=1 Tax=Brachionichthys hirsutus TaxID=412623 RepID=UPI003604F9AE
MGLPKALGATVVILVILYHMKNSPPQPVFTQGTMVEESLSIHDRVKRAVPANTSFEIQVYINTTDLENLQRLLETFSFPIFNDTFEISSINLTTVCLPHMNGFQCRCEQNFVWSNETCVTYGACDDIIGDTCGCINDLPASHIICQPNPTQIEIDLVFEIPNAPSNFFVQLRENLAGFPLPFEIIPYSLKVTDLIFTTGCSSIRDGGTQCQCETGFLWSCENCDAFGPCGGRTEEQCDCINGLPSFEDFCEPTPSDIQCPTVAANVTFILDLQFDESYNNEGNNVYITTNTVIQEQTEIHISSRISAEILAFTNGSTVVLYNVRATTFLENELGNAQNGILAQMSTLFRVVIDAGPTLQFNPPEVIVGEALTVACGPPPEIFDTDWTVEWRLNNELVVEDDRHSFSQSSEMAFLTLSSFFGFDNGLYECRLIDGNLTHLQTSGVEVVARETPVITVSPVRIRVNCEDPQDVQLTCSVNGDFQVEFVGIPEAGTGQNIRHAFTITNCDSTEEIFICQVMDRPRFSRVITLALSDEDFVCVDDPVFGDGNIDDRAAGPCEPDSVGQITAVCRADGEWEPELDLCVLGVIQELLILSENLNRITLPILLRELSEVTLNVTDDLADSPATITAIVQILTTAANTSSISFITISQDSITNILVTTGVLSSDGMRESWDFLNFNDTRNFLFRLNNTGNVSTTRIAIRNTESVSSRLLLSLEVFASRLPSDSFDVSTSLILLNKTTFTNTFNGDFNSSVEIDIPESDCGEESLTVITFASMDNVIPPRIEDNASSFLINGRVVIVQSSGNISNISFAFDVLNDTLRRPRCVFWNFSLLDELGGWDSEGCEVVINVNQTVTCNCNHLTPFSILMSPFGVNIPGLDIVTYIGVGISMASLVICLIIEGYVWRKIRKNNTSYLRHVSIINIALSLLIANIWFIVGAAISDPESQELASCSAATFFIHFFYLALFFWMLASALLLLYRTVSVFEGGLSKRAMLAIGFVIGYGSPVIIATITVAVTAPNEEYTRRNGICWLNYNESKALLAFVVPVLTIIGINLIILLVVIYKMLRRRAVVSAAQLSEKNVLVVIIRTLLILTPFFGFTWGLGVGIVVSPANIGINIAFAVFNSLQGFFILVFGTLLDKKVRSELSISSLLSKTGARTTSTTGSSTGLGFLRNWRRGRDGYNTSSGVSPVSQSNTEQQPSTDT